MEAASPEKLLEAFKVLDIDAKGYLTKEYISKVMTTDGEPFTQVSQSRCIYLIRSIFQNNIGRTG